MYFCADGVLEATERQFTEGQAKSFYELVHRLKAEGYEIPKHHLQASYGVLNYPEFSGDYARIGIALYGVLSSQSDTNNCRLEIKPVLSLKARVIAVKELYCGESAGYGLAFTAEKDMKIATISIGYADGFPRALSMGVGGVLINGIKAKIIGRICMDQTMIDITDIPEVRQGETAVVIGRSGEEEITAGNLAEQTGTITNEILSRLGGRLSRSFC